MKTIRFNRINKDNCELEQNAAALHAEKEANGTADDKKKASSEEEHSLFITREEAFHRYIEYRKNTSHGTRVSIVLTMLSAFILLNVLTLAVFLKVWNLDIQTCKSDILYTMGTIEQRSFFSRDLLCYHDTRREAAIKKELQLMKLCLNNTPKEQWGEKMDTLVSEDISAEFYLLSGNQVTLKSSNAGRLDLTDEQLSQIRRGETVRILKEGTDSLYAAIRMRGAYLVSAFKDMDRLKIRDIRETYGTTQTVLDGGIIVFHPETGEVYAVVENQFVGGVKIDEEVLVKGGYETNCFRDYYSFRDLISDFNTIQVLEKQLDQDTSVIVYHSLKECLKTTFYDLAVPIFVFYLIGLVVILNIGVMLTIRAQIRARKSVIHILGKLYFDKLIAKRFASLLMISELLMITAIVYLAYLNNISYENIRASFNFKNINSEKEYDMKDAEYLKDLRNLELSYILDLSANLIESDPAMSSTEMLKEIENILGAYDITIFDSQGISTASSNGYSGYKLGRDDTNGTEDPLLLLLESSQKSKIVCLDEKTGRSYYGTKRKQETGLIRFEITNNEYDFYLKEIQEDNVLLEADFGTADIFYYDASNPDKLKVSYAGKGEIYSVENDLSEGVMHDGYFGLNTINGVRYYLNVASDQNVPGNYFIQAERNDTLMEYVWIVVQSIFIASCIVFPVLWLRGSLFRNTNNNVFFLEKEEKKLEDSEDEEAIRIFHEKKRYLSQTLELLQKDYSRTTSYLVFSCVVSFFVFFLIDILKLRTNISMLKYLNSFNWDKGFNVFSFTLIIFYTFLIWFFGFLASKLIRTISENMGPAGVTVGRLLVSLIRFLMALAIILVVLSMFGVNTRTILASAGLTSVVIGIGAQSTVNNILAGLFIIFEGNFQVGEIVSINGWMGVIKEIGVRTTIIESYGKLDEYQNLRVIDNSDMKDITNCSRQESMATAYIPIPYEADLEKIEEIFKENKHLLASVTPDLIEGPFYDGVIRLEDSAKIIRFRVKCKEADRPRYCNLLMQYTTMMLEQNDISIPFNQLVIRSE